MEIVDRPSSGRVEIVPERSQVRLNVSGRLDADTLDQLEDAVVSLISRGFERLTIDVRHVGAAAVATPATLAAIDRRARAHGAHLSVIVGQSAPMQALSHAGLLTGLALQPTQPSMFFDWSA